MELKRAVEEAKRRCEGLEDCIQSLRISSSTDSWKTTLLRLVRSELKFLSRCSVPLSDSENSHSFVNSSNRSSNSNTSLSVNVGHLESVVHILQQPFITGVSRVCKSIPLSSSEKLVHKALACVRSIYVDIVCCLNGKPVWFIVSDRNPKYISWLESSGNRGLRTRIETILEAAQSSETLRPSSIVLFFSNGLDDILHKKLQDEFGAANLGLAFPNFGFSFSEESEDCWTNVLARSYHQACVLVIEVSPSANAISTSRAECDGRLTSDPLTVEYSFALGDSYCSLISVMKCCSLDTGISQPKNLSDGIFELVNFDTTALIAIVSEISNGGIAKLLATPESELRSRFKGNYEFVLGQVGQFELQNPMHVGLTGDLFGKGGVICESVYLEFQEIVSMCGGPNEKLRANHILKHLKVVPDCPSSRMRSLPTTRKLALKNKVVFGTGDHWHAPTLTANMAFVRAVSQTGMSLFTIEHKPRALIGH